MSQTPTPATANQRRKPAHPFIIWTVQRTGGTNLAQQLFRASALPGTDGVTLATGPGIGTITDAWQLHEPFNEGTPPRPFAHATEAYTATGDLGPLRTAIESICRLGLPIKHCVEMVPPIVSELLAKTSVKHGYRHIFLYRENPVDRLLSMEFARRSGVWGPAHRGRMAPREEVFGQPLPVADLVHHEQLCASRLCQAWALLAGMDAKPKAISFESVYEQTQPDEVDAVLSQLLRHLGLNRGHRTNRSLIEAILKRGEQGTREDYRAFAGLDELGAALRAVRPFSPSRYLELSVTALSGQPDFVVHAALDWHPRRIWPGEPYAVGGVVVLTHQAPIDCALAVAGQPEVSCDWSIASPRMADSHPEARNAANARFLLKNVITASPGCSTVVLVSGRGEWPLFHLNVPAGQPPLLPNET